MHILGQLVYSGATKRFILATARRAAAAAPGVDAPARPEGKTHRADPDFGSTLTASNRDSQSNCWVIWKIIGQPCGFQVPAAKGRPPPPPPPPPPSVAGGPKPGDGGGGGNRARSHRRFARPPISVIPDSLRYSVPLFLKRQCDRTPGGNQEMLAELRRVMARRQRAER
jgi:hypothetical protein